MTAGTAAKPIKQETEGATPNQDLLPTNFAKETKL
jgi:hypothetical protein